MKMTGICAVCLFVLMRRQVSNPSMPGMTASSRMRSGVTFFSRPRAVVPSTAASAIMSALSSAAVMKPSESGESSTTSTMSRRPALPFIITERLQIIDDFAETETPELFAHDRNGRPGARLVPFELIKSRTHAGGVPDAAERDDAVNLDAVSERDDSGSLPHALLRQRQFVGPFERKQILQAFEQLPYIDRLHEKRVMTRLGAIGRADFVHVRRHHHDRHSAPKGLTQALRDRPSAHARHRDVEQH